MVETELFPRGALEYYTAKNMGGITQRRIRRCRQMNERGGDQGDYRDGMPEKIENVIACLKAEPRSKRAVIPIPFSNEEVEQLIGRIRDKQNVAESHGY